jgi:[CysO sulfur-carrier protein]-S-L-cysteine hydrolase
MTRRVSQPAEEIVLPTHLRGLIVEHCVQALPEEGCGLFAVEGDEVKAIYPTANLDRSPAGYTVPPQQHHDALVAAEAKGWTLGGSFHSHPLTRPVPSRRDIAAALDPEWIQLIVGLGGEIDIRAWRIRGGRVTEVAIG